ncbi:uncharacterized protein LOC103721135 [Phoenix dactylifera]|uniref:Uncharacterized protein LOC103721135 n=1 Tax=Phoenix dactylifera TaxID=42345 RepID=A0A8B9ANG4_PHODC|nr:uncharacterized protein LOC103721135 [Phoenix dactylifera]
MWHAGHWRRKRRGREREERRLDGGGSVAKKFIGGFRLIHHSDSRAGCAESAAVQAAIGQLQNEHGAAVGLPRSANGASAPSRPRKVEQGIAIVIPCFAASIAPRAGVGWACRFQPIKALFSQDHCFHKHYEIGLLPKYKMPPSSKPRDRRTAPDQRKPLSRSDPIPILAKENPKQFSANPIFYSIPSPFTFPSSSSLFSSLRIVPKRLSWEFSTAREGIHHDPSDPDDSSPEATSNVEDPAETHKPLISVSFKIDEIVVVESGEPTGGCTDSDAAEREEKEMDKEKVRAVLVIDRVREALLEIGAPDLSDGSKKAVEALVEIVIGDVGMDSRARDGLSNLDLWADVRTVILICLI